MDWIDRLEGYFEDPAVGAAGGAVGICDPTNLSGCAVYFLEFLYHFPGTGAPQRNENFLVGCNSVYRADLLHRVQFPDQTLGEDVLFRICFTPKESEWSTTRRSKCGITTAKAGRILCVQPEDGADGCKLSPRHAAVVDRAVLRGAASHVPGPAL